MWEDCGIISVWNWHFYEKNLPYLWTTYLIFTNKTLCVVSNFCTAFPTDISIITKQKFLHNVIKTPFYVTTHNNQAISKRLVDSLLSQVWYTIIEQQSMLTNKTFKAISQDTFEKFPNYIIRGNCTTRDCGVYLFLLWKYILVCDAKG